VETCLTFYYLTLRKRLPLKKTTRTELFTLSIQSRMFIKMNNDACVNPP